MRSLAVAFHEGGWPMYVILLLALLGHVAAVVALILGRKGKNLARVTGLLALGLGLATAGMGWFGNHLGRNMTEAAVAMVDPRDKMAIMNQGYAEAAQNLKFGLGAAIIPSLVGLIFVGRSMGEPDKDPALPR
jgi:hypothetical protein